MFITSYMNNCIFCGRPNDDMHHLCYGTANRNLSDVDGLVVPVCRSCHDFIHRNGTAGMMSKIIGQLVYEINTVSDKEQILDAREKFRKRYGQSFL